MSGGGTAGTIQTVCGPIGAEELGHTQPHEHVLVDLAGPLRDPQTRRLLPPEVLLRIDEPISLQNHGWLRRNWMSTHNSVLASVDDASSELLLYFEAGGRTIVDVSSIGIGRDPRGLLATSTATGVNIVMGSGSYVAAFQTADELELSTAQLAERIVRDIQEGVDGSGIKAGVIGEVGVSSPMHPFERRSLLASAAAQAQTGALVVVHPAREPSSPLEIVRLLEGAGVDPCRVMMSHVDRTLFDPADLMALARTGCYISFDLFGKESTYYPAADFDMPNDGTRVDRLRALADAGHLSSILVSQDICMKINLVKYGGEGYAHILAAVAPLMARKGFSQQEIDQIFVANPRAALIPA